ncbi:MAG: hypothetical protein LLF94_05315 [Chlamydiales bacterium]|nr:hypothetical protein [Chlamydiales bacterium]
MHVSSFDGHFYFDAMDTSDDVVSFVDAVDIQPHEYQTMDIGDDVENIDCENEKKRKKEESLRPARMDAGNVTKKLKTLKKVHFADGLPFGEVDPNAMEIDRPYDLTQSAEAQGWVLKTPEHQIFCIHPRSLRRMTDTDFIHFARQNPSFTKLRIYNAEEITDFGFCEMIQGRKNLRAVDIAECSNLTNNSLFALSNHCQLLSDCSLLKCHKISDQGVILLVTQCKELRTLYLDWCYGVTDASLYVIAENCPRLLELSLTEGTQFSLTAIKAVLQGCQWLEKLDLWSCTQVTDAWIDTIIDWGRNIKELDLKYCTGISPQAICRLKARFPTLNLNH